MMMIRGEPPDSLICFVLHHLSIPPANNTPLHSGHFSGLWISQKYTSACVCKDTECPTKDISTTIHQSCHYPKSKKDGFLHDLACCADVLY